MQRALPIRNLFVIWLAFHVVGLAGCQTLSNLESVRRVAYVASLGSPTTVKVKERKKSGFTERVFSAVGVVPKPDARSLQILRRYGLDKVWENDPKEAIQQLARSLATDQNLESISALANLRFVWAERLRMSGQKHKALSEYADTTVLGYQFLFDQKYDRFRNAYDPKFRGICDLYNRSLENMLRIIDEENTLRPNYKYQIKTEAGEIRFTTVLPGRWRHENIDNLQFVSDFETSGLANEYRSFGLGVPLIANWKVEKGKSPVSDYYPPGLTISLTAFMKVDQHRTEATDGSSTLECTLYFHDPLETTEIQVGNRKAPIESDVSTPLALFLNDPLLNTKLLGVLSMVNNDLAKEVSGLYMLEPYNPRKIPVVLVHGLGSSPTTWTDMFNDLRADPRLRDHYQFWFYMYPTGQPFWISAKEMRADMKQARLAVDPSRQNRILDEMVYVGHSMGGLVSRLQTIYSDEHFWKLVSESDPTQLEGDPEAIQDLVATFQFEPNRSIRRVVTIGSPHLGSDFANGTTQWLSRSFFKISEMFEGNDEIVKANPKRLADSKLLKIRTSIDALSPESPFFAALKNTRAAPWVTYHNIYGNTNRIDVLSVVGSRIIGPGDGIVPVESARAIVAKSEIEVNANHGDIHGDPSTIREVKRILIENLVESGRISTSVANPLLPISEPFTHARCRDIDQALLEHQNHSLVPYQENRTKTFSNEQQQDPTPIRR